MNILLVCNKQDTKEYEAVLKAAPNTTLLGAVTVISKNFIEDINERWTPHTIFYVNGVKYIDECTFSQTLKDIRTRYSYIKIVYLHGAENKITSKEAINTLAEINIFSVITRNITNLELNEILKAPFQSTEEAEVFNKKPFIPPPVKKKQRIHKIKPLVIAAIAAIVLVIIITLGLVLKNINTSEPDETTTEPNTAEAIMLTTEPATTAPTEPETEPETIPTVAVTPTQAPTEPPTEKPAEKPTEAPKETASSKSPGSTSGNSGGTGNSNQNSTSSQNNNQSNKPEQSNNSVVAPAQPESMPPITDDGNIYFDQDEYKVKAGEEFEIKVSGLSASKGCDWSLENNAIIKFVSADTTKVVVKAISPGVTTVTAKAKTNGAARQVLVTVE